MKLRKTTLALLIGLLVLVTGAAATAAGQTTTAQNGSNQTGGEVISEGLTLVNTEYRAGDDGNGTLALTFQADGPTATTLYDAGAFRYGGKIPSRTSVIDGRYTMEMPVTEVDGMVGVTVVADGTRYAVPVEVDSTSEIGPPVSIDWLALFVGIGLVGISAVGYHKYRDKQQSQEVRSVAK